MFQSQKITEGRANTLSLFSRETLKIVPNFHSSIYLFIYLFIYFSHYKHIYDVIASQSDLERFKRKQSKWCVHFHFTTSLHDSPHP